MICERCGVNEARPQQCPGDRAWHRHGAVHTIRNGESSMEDVCDECIQTVRDEWTAQTVIAEVERQRA